jgi:hypothetical protein
MLIPFSEKINSLSEDELSMLYGIVNFLHPRCLSYELPLSLILCIKPNKLKQKIVSAKQNINPDFMDIYDGLIKKILS